MNAHAPSKQTAVACLQRVVNRLINDNRARCFWLGFMPILDGTVQSGFEGGLELEVLCRLVDVVAPIPRAVSHQPGFGQDFFREIALRTLITS